jgi:hypothetical protein
VGWELYRQLVAEGSAPAYVDIDQLGMCSPEPSGDPGRWALKDRNLAAVVARFAEAGADRVIVSGVVDRSAPVDARDLGPVDLTLCRLRADRHELVRRLTGRGGAATDIEVALGEADALDASTIAEACVDTTGRSLGDVVALVRSRTGEQHAGRTAPTPASTPAVRPARDGGGGVLWLSGPTGVGKSTIGFAAYLQILETGRAAAYLDVDQIGFCSTALGDHALRARILVDVRDSFRTAGADTLVVVGPVDDEAASDVYAAALSGVPTTHCRLHASADELTTRILSRRHGGSWHQPGDPLRGQPESTLLAVADAAVARDAALESAGIGVRVDTDGRAVDDIARSIVDATSWLTTR